MHSSSWNPLHLSPKGTCVNRNQQLNRTMSRSHFSRVAVAILSGMQLMNVGCFTSRQVMDPRGGPPITQILVDPAALSGQVPNVFLPQGPVQSSAGPIAGVSFQNTGAFAPSSTVASQPAPAGPVNPSAPGATNVEAPISLAGMSSGYGSDSPTTASAAYAPRTVAAAPQTTAARVAARADDNYSLKAITGSPDANQYAALRDAVNDYPASYLRNLTLHFPYAEPPNYTTDTGISGRLRGEHNPNTQTITMYRLHQAGTQQVNVDETALVLSHEIAHHVMDTVQPQWAASFKVILGSALYNGQNARSAPHGTDGLIVNVNRANLPPTDYALKSAQRADVNEVAAEAISFYLQGKWSPQDTNVLNALIQLKNAKFTNANVDTGIAYNAG